MTPTRTATQRYGTLKYCYEDEVREYVAKMQEQCPDIPLTITTRNTSGKRLTCFVGLAENPESKVIFSMHKSQHLKFYEIRDELRAVLDGLTQPVQTTPEVQEVHLSDTEWDYAATYAPFVASLPAGQHAYTAPDCTVCGDTGKLDCDDCGGCGTRTNSWGDLVECETCDGRGRRQCKHCMSTPSVPQSQHALLNAAAYVPTESVNGLLMPVGTTPVAATLNECEPQRVYASDVARVMTGSLDGTRELLDAEERALRKHEKHAKKDKFAAVTERIMSDKPTQPTGKAKQFRTPTYKREKITDHYGDMLRTAKAQIETSI